MARYSRKGNLAFDILVLIVALCIFAVLIIFHFMMQNDFNDAIQDDSTIPQNVKDVSQEYTDSYVSTWDGGFVFFFILLWIVMIISSFFIDSHPIFFWISAILMIFVVIFAAYISNSYEEFTQDEEILEFSEVFPNMNYIMMHLVEFVIAIFATVGIARWAKNRSPP